MLFAYSTVFSLMPQPPLLCEEGNFPQQQPNAPSPALNDERDESYFCFSVEKVSGCDDRSPSVIVTVNFLRGGRSK